MAWVAANTGSRAADTELKQELDRVAGAVAQQHMDLGLEGGR
jgi:hypothetical protein